MYTTGEQNISDFWIVGINYKKTDAAMRGSFAINSDQYEQLLSIAPQYSLSDLFVLSTCNRTEIYGFASNAMQLTDLLCDTSNGDRNTFAELAYIKNGSEAVQHLFQVAAGLDSQILGDYEILGQIKKAAKLAKAHGFLGTTMERIVNSALQASKAVKTNTTLSGGTVSVSFAAVQYIKEYVSDVERKKIVVLGTGKIGTVTCRNLVDYLHTKNITLINRTEETANNLARELHLASAPIETMEDELRDADIILVSTSAAEPMIRKEHLVNQGTKLVIDLSVPCNVDAAARMLPNVIFADVDMLSRIKDETLQQRMQEVPKALLILDEHMADLMKWHEMRRYAPVLKEVKNKLKEIYITPLLCNGNHTNNAEQIVLHEERIQKAINTLATKIRRDQTPGCNYIEAITNFIA